MKTLRLPYLKQVVIGSWLASLKQASGRNKLSTSTDPLARMARGGARTTTHFPAPTVFRGNLFVLLRSTRNAVLPCVAQYQPCHPAGWSLLVWRGVCLVRGHGMAWVNAL